MFITLLRIDLAHSLFQAMPNDLVDGFDQATETWVSDDKEVEIKAGAAIRLRILGISIDATEIVRAPCTPTYYFPCTFGMYSLYISYLQTAIGTIKDDYLGLVDVA